MSYYLKSSIGRKTVVAITGLFLFGFVIVHMLGNLQIFLGQEWLNSYAEHLKDLPFLLWPARIFLLAIFTTHIVFALQLAVENKRARPVSYVFQDTVQADLASRTMVISGLLVLFFVIYHLLHFTLGMTNPEFFHLTDSQGRHDVYSMVVFSYRNVFISGAYVLAMAVLCVHLGHGLPSFMQTLGLTDERTLPRFQKTGRILAWLIFLGNSSIPAAVFLGFVKLPGKGM